MVSAQLEFQHGYMLNYIKVSQGRFFQNPTYLQFMITFSCHSAPFNECNLRIIAEET